MPFVSRRTLDLAVGSTVRRRPSWADQMRRRDFITALSSAASWPFMARAQQPSKMKRIAFVNSAGEVTAINVRYRAFFEELSRLGYVEAQNIEVEPYSGEGRTEHYPQLARDVV